MDLQISTGLKNALLAKEEERKRLQAIIKAGDMTLTTGPIFEENITAIDSEVETCADKQ